MSQKKRKIKVTQNDSKRLKLISVPGNCSPPFIKFVHSVDIVNYIFSFVSDFYIPIFKLVSKEWYFRFKENTTYYDLCRFFSKKGYLNCLKWARNHGYDWNELICANAAKGGHFDILKWAHGNGCPWDEGTCALAAEGGHLDILKWAHENDCPWDELTCGRAAFGGHLDILKWLRENG